MDDRIYNFSAGPAVLPLSALKAAQKELLALPGIGMSVLEISHRSKPFEAILNETITNLRKLLHIPDNYKVLFLQGGASLQFSMISMNFLRASNRPAAYLVTGTWGQKAVKEAQREGEVVIAWNGKDSGFTRVPDASEITLPANPAYVHYTTNETIQGVQFHHLPTSGDAPLICDMSSDFLCRPVNVSKHALIYAGAQKNAGPAGVTMVILRDDLLETIPDGLHTMLDYRTHANNNSLYNTPPVFSIYMVMQVTRWLLNEIGSLDTMYHLNTNKASLLYHLIDESNGFYRPHAAPNSRSLMNVTFRLPTEELEAEFISQASKRRLSGLKGHRSVGGIRASIYNAMPLDGVQALADFMTEFKASHS